MGINISVQYNGGFLPDIILLTQSHFGEPCMGCVLTTYVYNTVVYYYYIV